MRHARILTVLAVFYLGWTHRWIGDDGFINVRFVQNILAGFGPVFNPAQRVEAVTSPLWCWLVALGSWPGFRIEHVAVALGLSCSALGVGIATLAQSGRRWAIGSLCYVAIPVAWDYFTSGLENGLSVLWLASVFALGERQKNTSWKWPLLLGLGPLVRPDFALICGTVGLEHLHRISRLQNDRVRASLTFAAVAVAPGLVYEIFRAGYYGCLVPNTALAKTAEGSHWGQGWLYLANFAGLYWLALPVSVFVVLRILSRDNLSRFAWAYLLGCIACALFVTRVGGDFMHGRLLLPATFGILTVLGQISTESRVWPRVAVLVSTAWIIAIAGFVRVSPENENGIGDERGWYARMAGIPHPVVVEDYRNFDWFQTFAHRRSRCLTERVGCNAYQPEYSEDRLATASWLRRSADFATDSYAVGIRGVVVGLRTHMIDRAGLGDPVGARVRIEGRGRPGHEKDLSQAWILDLYVNDISRHRCHALAELHNAVSEPMSVARFVHNVTLAPRLTRLSFPADPALLTDTTCNAL